MPFFFEHGEDVAKESPFIVYGPFKDEGAVGGYIHTVEMSLGFEQCLSFWIKEDEEFVFLFRVREVARIAEVDDGRVVHELFDEDGIRGRNIPSFLKPFIHCCFFYSTLFS